MKCDCGGDIHYVAAVEKNDQGRMIYQCSLCGQELEQAYYKYTPSTCPKHHWQFETWGFYDDPNKHEIYWNMLCDRCGARAKKRWDSREVGLKEAVSVEDPKVLKHLELNKHTAKFLLDKETAKEFWGL